MCASPQANAELDVKGLLCPLPLVKLYQKIATIDVGAVLHAVSDDPICMAEVPAWVHAAGHELISADHDGGEYVFLIRRAI
jgi:tRNA 2-thiouridine synthesizing protein A